MVILNNYWGFFNKTFMKYFRLRIITETLETRNKAVELAEIIQKALRLKTKFKIDKYHKFKNSYEIEFYDELFNNVHFIAKSVRMTDKICSPWLTTYHHDSKEIELIFNKTESSFYQNKSFEIIKWAIFTVENS